MIGAVKLLLNLLYLSNTTTENTTSENHPSDTSVTKISQSCEMPKFLCAKTQYRTLDGSCNNLLRPEWGSAGMPYGRLLNNTYSDGIYEFPLSSTGEELPNAREMSRVLFPPKDIQDEGSTLITMQWGQIVAHDLSLTMGISQTLQNPTPCCDGGKFLDPKTTSPRCKPIARPANDPATLEEGNVCIDFVRTISTKDQNCASAKEPSRPLSVPTAFLDLSIQYGNNVSRSNALRAGYGGRLLTVVRNGHEWPPQDPNITAACAVNSANEPCYFSGDIRINQNLELTILQIVLLREHNRIADELKSINPHWSDEKLFQEARRIVIAIIQHITYYEYLPGELGYDNMVKYKVIYPNVEGHVNDYNSKVDPSIDVMFALAFRFFHTAINGQLKSFNENRDETDSLRLSDWYVKPSILEKNDYFAGLSRGLCTQTENDYDQFLTSEITDYFFRLNSTYGDDVRAIDIQRSRDLGTVSYIGARTYFNSSLKSDLSFDDFKDYISSDNVDKLKLFYKNPNDTELFVAGCLEEKVGDAMIGPTFLKIFLKQFKNTRVGDRFFYENGYDKKNSFTSAQLNSIRKMSVARLMCNNADLTEIQRHAFRVISKENPLVPCKEIPSLDLRLWKVKR